MSNDPTSPQTQPNEEMNNEQKGASKEVAEKECAADGCNKANAVLKCSRCKMAVYCNTDCQKSYRSIHKLECFPPGAKCTRCNEAAIPNTICRVGHPKRFLEPTGVQMTGGIAYAHTLCCNVCKQMYKSEAIPHPLKCGLDKVDDMVLHEWCYEGPHTVKPLRGADKKRAQG